MSMYHQNEYSDGMVGVELQFHCPFHVGDIMMMMMMMAACVGGSCAFRFSLCCTA